MDETVHALKAYYGRIGRIGLDFTRALVPVTRVRNAAARLGIEVTPMLGDLRGAATGATSVAFGPGAGLDGTGSPTLLVEADGSRPGFGVFLVENLTASPVSASISVSTFVDEHGREVRPRLALRPATVSLKPGEQAIVQLVAEIDEALEPGVRYRGEISIPALSDQRIPIVLRRHSAEPAEDRLAGGAPEEPVAADAAWARRRTAGPAAARPAESASNPRRRRATAPPDVPH